MELRLSDSEATRAVWPHAFVLTYRLSFEAGSLRCSLEVENPAGSGSAFAFEALLHTYLALQPGSVTAEGSSSTVCGLQGVTYKSKPKGGAEFTESSSAFQLAGEVDHIYMNTPAEVLVKGIWPAESGSSSSSSSRKRSTVRVGRQATLRSSGAKGGVAALPLDVVVWNPGAARAAAIADLGPAEWQSFVCVEPGRVAPPTVLPGGGLQPGQLFTLTQTLTLED
jgi:glucose-6-phosphate 1-epimerase